MTGTETTIVRQDGDNKPMTINVVTGIVERHMYYYPTPLKSEAARRLFLDLVGIAYSDEVPALIRACNRAAARRQPMTDDERRETALQYAGIAEKPIRAAKPHRRSCTCPRCFIDHVKAGCRVPGCKVCFT